MPILSGAPGAQKGVFSEPEDLKLEFKDMVLDGRNIILNKYDPSNPHPGFGKDPNILNEYGHSQYPKMIYPEGPNGKGVVVKSPEEENELLNPASVPASGKQQQPQQQNNNSGWPSK